MRFASLAGFIVLLNPQSAWAAGADALEVHPLSVAPFVLLLLAIALLPIVAGHFWHSNFRRALVVLALSLPAVGYLCWLEISTGQPALAKLEHSLLEYVDFIILLGALYTVAGGILVDVQVRPHAGVNTLLLAVGAVLANLIGTTGASMLLIRPFLRINARRTNNRHLPVFFIFVVANLGGLLTPLGDPPLYLGFLRGVRFSWTLQLLPHWAVGVGCVLAVFFVWDAWALSREPEAIRTQWTGGERKLRLHGRINFVFLAGILAAVLLQSPLADAVQQWLNQFFACPELRLLTAGAWLEQVRGGEMLPLPSGAVMLAMALFSLGFTRSAVRHVNHFTWGALIEVAVLFVGIFATMVPAMELLAKHGGELGITQAWQYFWLTGSLSSLLDNAPTYLAFATIASHGEDLGAFADAGGQATLVLQAISVGAVFMGALTYVGNGPNFMVKAIADAAGHRTPSFFGYMLYAILILLPIFGLVTWLFFV
jgi:Na+/H+ antiporter NhaD/arsenite permease-like protein